MRKRLFLIFLSLVLCIGMLSACGKNNEQGPEVENNQVSNDSEENKGEENVPSDQEDIKEEIEEEPEEPEETETEPEVSEPPKDEEEKAPGTSYTVKVKAPFDIYKSPEYDSVRVDTIWEKGLFTIIEEKTDEEGNLWGKLKSGLGWICLSRIENEAALPVRAALIEKNEIQKNSIEVVLEESEYMVRLAFVANENLKDLRFTTIYLSDDGLKDETLYTFKELKEGQMFVAGVVFAGDMTSFGLEFVDAQGQTQYYTTYISGRNGELILQEKEAQF